MNDDPMRIERFREIYDAHHGDLWRYCLRRTSSAAEAEDVLGDVFTVAWRRLDDVPRDDMARPWLFAVARNHVHNHWRRTSRDHATHLRLVSEAATAATADNPPDGGGDDRSALVLDALGQLSEPEAEILRLVVWEELSHREIAAVMDCTENAVAIRVHRARRHLAEHLTARLTDEAPNTATPNISTSHTEGDRNA